MRRKLTLGAALALVLLASGASWARMGQVVSRPLSAQEIKDYKLAPTTQKSAGLWTVGVGTPVYLEAWGDSARAAAGTSWTMTSSPSGSAAALATSPLGADVPVPEPGYAAEASIAGRKLLVPDKVGQYAITAVIGDTTVSVTVTAANYVGVGGVAGAAPAFPQCAICHADKVTQWNGTGHATMLQQGVDGIKSDHYGENCVSCHTVGFDKAATAVNGGFDDVLKTTGWGTSAADARGDSAGNWWKVLKAGNFAAMPAALQAKSNIQCENCHGPGSEHKGDPSKIAVSSSAGNCGFCHDSMNTHYRNAEWRNSRHATATAEPSGPGEGGCVVCHTGEGFQNRVKGGVDIVQADYATKATNLEYSPIGCSTCHDPHDGTNPAQLRTVADVTLMNGVVVTEGGTGKLCMSCHKTRRNNGPSASPRPYSEIWHSRQNPHYGAQTDMLAGTNGPNYGPLPSSTHLYAVENTCATCHMQMVTAKLADNTTANPMFSHAGGHTFSNKFDNGTPADETDDVDLTAACVTCHGPTDSFDMPRQDFDGDGVVEGVQTEVDGLMALLVQALPIKGSAAAAIAVDTTNSAWLTQKVALNKAVYAYNYVYYDGSRGIHNTRYTVAMLKAAIKEVTGRDVATAVATEQLSSKPQGYALAQNHPNPFNPETEIRYSVPAPGNVRIDIFNTIGQRVRSLVDAQHATGEFAVKWDGRDADGAKLTAGVYIYTMQAGSFVQTHKMVLLP